VGLAQDDDEMTHWASDGQLANAWIEYQLDKPQVVDEVVLKLIGWRLRSYPLRITMDGVTVYEGVPAKSLGYVTLPLKPVKGRKLRIALTGPTVDRDAFGKIVEITGAGRASTPAPRRWRPAAVWGSSRRRFIGGP
jgi:beta-galactosidase